MEVPGLEDCEIGINSSGCDILLWDLISSLRPRGKAILNSGLLFHCKSQTPNDSLWGKPESEKWSMCFRNQRPSAQDKLLPHEGSEEKQPHFSYLPRKSSLIQSRVMMRLFRRCSFWGHRVSWAALRWDCGRSRSLKAQEYLGWGISHDEAAKPQTEFVLQANHETIYYEAWEFSDAPWTSFYCKFFSNDFFT